MFQKKLFWIKYNINKFYLYLKLKKIIKETLKEIIFLLKPNLFFIIEIKNKKLLESSLILNESSNYKINAPRFENQINYSKSGIYKEIKAHKINSAVVSAYSSSILIGKKLYVPNLVFKNPFKYGVSVFGLIFRKYPFIDDTKNYKIKLFKPLFRSDYLELENGILIGGCGSDNWFHWIVEVLPKLYLSNKLPKEFSNYPIIVPNKCKTNKNFLESLNLFNSLKKKIYYLKKNDFVRVKNLIYIDDVIEYPFQVKKDKRVSLKDYSFNQKLLKEYAKKFCLFGSFDNQLKTEKSKFFLARKNSLRNYNQGELIMISKKYSFETIFLEDYTLKEQIYFLSQASFLIGPSGAAWTSLMFNNKGGIKCLSWLPEYYSEASTYSSIAGLMGHQLNFLYVEYSGNKHDFHTEDYYIDPKYFEFNLRKLLNQT